MDTNNAQVILDAGASLVDPVREHGGIPVFQGSTAAYPIEARLKYRQQSDKLVFWFELIRPDRVFKQAVTDDIERIHEATGFMLLYGNAGL